MAALYTKTANRRKFALAGASFMPGGEQGSSLSASRKASGHGSRHVPCHLPSSRDKAIGAKRLLATGQDPIAERTRVRNQKPIPTFRGIAAEVIEHEQAKAGNEKVRYQWSLLLGEAYCSSILDKAVNAITTRDVERLLRPIWNAKPETARKLYRPLRRVFDHARVRLRDEHNVVMAENPAKWDDLKALGFTTPKKLSRGPQPSLDYREASSLLAALRSRDTRSSCALELLLLTAVRRMPCAGLNGTSLILRRPSGRSP